MTATFTCSEQADADREARVEVWYDRGDGQPRAAHSTLTGSCGACPVAQIAVTDPSVDDIGPLDTVVLDGTGSASPNGKALRYRWYFKDAPEGSHTGFRPESNPTATETTQSGSTAAQPTFFADLVGIYEVCLEVCEEGGACTSELGCGGDQCLRLDVVAREYVHVQLVWDHPETDVDLHYLREGASYGDTTSENPGGDCYFLNPHPDYCEPGEGFDDPRLDGNDTGGYGPENVNHDHPCADRYRIWVSYHDDLGLGSTRAKVRVFLRGVMVAEESRVLDQADCHWLVGTIDWDGSSGSWETAVPYDYVCGRDNPED